MKGLAHQVRVPGAGSRAVAEFLLHLRGGKVREKGGSRNHGSISIVETAWLDFSFPPFADGGGDSGDSCVGGASGNFGSRGKGGSVIAVEVGDGCRREEILSKNEVRAILEENVGRARCRPE